LIKLSDNSSIGVGGGYMGFDRYLTHKVSNHSEESVNYCVTFSSDRIIGAFPGKKSHRTISSYSFTGHTPQLSHRSLFPGIVINRDNGDWSRFVYVE